jgi:hypothetical protein
MSDDGWVDASRLMMMGWDGISFAVWGGDGKIGSGCGGGEQSGILKAATESEKYAALFHDAG